MTEINTEFPSTRFSTKKSGSDGCSNYQIKTGNSRLSKTDPKRVDVPEVLLEQHKQHETVVRIKDRMNKFNLISGKLLNILKENKADLRIANKEIESCHKDLLICLDKLNSHPGNKQQSIVMMLVVVVFIAMVFFIAFSSK